MALLKTRFRSRLLLVLFATVGLFFFFSQRDSYNASISAISEQSSTILNKYTKNNHAHGAAAESSATPDRKQLDLISVDSFLSGDPLVHSFFGNFFELLAKNKASYPLKRRMKLEKDGKPHIDNVLFYSEESELLSENELLTYFDFPTDFVDDLTLKHKNIVANLPEFIPKFYKDSGYAIVGGGKYSWFSYLAVKSLRKVGAILPVEVVLPTQADYEELLCETLLPNLNARCIQMEHIFGKKNMDELKLTGYQLKSLALLASSFENVFLLDSDSYAVTNPEPIFTSDLYKKYHMITWPDFWRRTTSPLFYKIAGIDVPEEVVRHINDDFTDVTLMDLAHGKLPSQIDPKADYNFHDRKNTLMDYSTESGEMLIDKKTHFKSLFLALYYNYDGPFCYHPLLSQGGAGEGDKETFVAAANYFGLPFYQVYKKADRTYGFYNHLQTFEHGAIVQYDPLTDYENVQSVERKIKNDIKSQGSHFKYDYDKYFGPLHSIGESRPMFYHCHDPKFDPFFLIAEKKMFVRVDNQEINERRRILGEDFPRASVDLELSLWEIAEDSICKKKLDFQIFKGKDHLKFCKETLPSQMKFLRESSKFIYKHFNTHTPTENYQGSNKLSEEMAADFRENPLDKKNH